MKPIIRYTGQLDSSPEQVRCINHLLEQPGPGSAYRVTIEPMQSNPRRYEIDLCRRLLSHAAFSSHTENLRWPEVKHLASRFFSQEVIDAASRELCGETEAAK